MPYETSTKNFYRRIHRDSDSDSKIKILAEGDSWLAYPRRFFVLGKNSNIVHHLADNDNVLINDISSGGDEIMEIISGSQKHTLIKELQDFKYDYLLFSGGGNDIVGKYDLDLLINKITESSSATWQDAINESMLNVRLTQLKNAYEFLIRLVEQESNSKEIKIITHTYDLAIPSDDGVGVSILGLRINIIAPWVKKYLSAKGINGHSDQTNIIHFLLSEFKKMITQLGNEHSILEVVDTHGAVDENQWVNEIHPNSLGFKSVTDRIYSRIIALEEAKGAASELTG